MRNFSAFYCADCNKLMGYFSSGYLPCIICEECNEKDEE